MAGLLNITPQQVAKDRKPKRLTGNYYAGGKQGAFIEQVMPHALRFAEQTGLDPRLAIATAALETGWGKHAPGGALFGIKGSGQDLMTTEYVDGKPVQMKQSFRRYDAAQDPAAASFDDFSKLMAESKYYGGVRATAGKPFEDQLAAFVASPYATNPKADRLDALRSIGSRIYVPDVAMSQVSQEPAMQHDVPLEQQDWVHRPALDTGEGYKPGLLQSAFNAALGISNAYGQEQQEPQTMAQRKSPWQQRIEFLEQAERDRKQNAGGLLDAAQQPIVLDMPAATPAASPAAGAGILQGLNPDITQEQINAQLGYPQPGEPIPTRDIASYDVVPPQPVPLQQAPAQAATAPIAAQAAMMQHPQLPPAQQPQNGLQRYAQGLLGNQAALGLISGGLLQAFGAKPQEAQQFGGRLAETLTQQRERQQQRDAVAALVRQAGGSEQDVALAYASPQMAMDMMQKRQAAMAPGERKMIQQDGVYYYADTGETVLKNVPPPSQAMSKADQAKAETELRKEYMGNKVVKDFAGQSAAYQRLENLASVGTGAADTSLIFSFMKTLDPTSVVREGEFRMAAENGGLDQRFVTMFTRVDSGERLTPEQRAEIVNSGRVIYQTAKDQYDMVTDQYSAIAQSYGLDPKRSLPTVTLPVQGSANQASGIPKAFAVDARAEYEKANGKVSDAVWNAAWKELTPEEKRAFGGGQ
jgi:hypothetical protein